MSRPTLPPRAAERLLVYAFGNDEWAESILGDLHEEYAHRAIRSSALAAAWYWAQVIRLTTRRGGEHHITIPDHDPLRPGTLSAILRDVAAHARLAREDLLRLLFE